MTQLQGTDGKVYQTGGELARGGEGSIVSLQGRGDLVAKLYFPGKATPARERKLRVMLANPPRDEMRLRYNHAAIAWPLDLLNEGGRFAGFIMPRIDAGHGLVNAYNRRAKQFLGFDWRGQHQVAANLCAAVNALHVKGYVVGDINPRNILVTGNGMVTLVDTDSFQVNDNGTVHRCPVGTPEYTPRELQGQHFEQIDRGQQHDRFGLAVLVFQLLMDGFHPFAGALRYPQDSVPGKIDEWCIQHGVFPWIDHPRLRRPTAARSLAQLDPELATFFKRCFVSGHTEPAKRPTALEWHKVLTSACKRLVHCQGGTHWQYPRSGPCLACGRQAQPKPAKTTPAPPPPPPPGPTQTTSVPSAPPVGKVLALLLAAAVAWMFIKPDGQPPTVRDAGGKTAEASPPKLPVTLPDCPDITDSEAQSRFAQATREHWSLVQTNEQFKEQWRKLREEQKKVLDNSEPSPNGPERKARAWVCLGALAETGDTEAKQIHEGFQSDYLMYRDKPALGNWFVALDQNPDSKPPPGYTRWLENSRALALAGDATAREDQTSLPALIGGKP